MTTYNIFDGYMISDIRGIELGFTNDDAVYDDDEEIIFEPGNPVFSHFNLYPKSEVLLPFGLTFNDTRQMVGSSPKLVEGCFRPGRPTYISTG